MGGEKKTNLHAAEDDDFLQNLFKNYATNGKNGIMEITKDKAYVAAAKCVERWRKLTGDENANYLKENFEASWNEHDIHHKNKIDLTEAYAMMKEL